VIKLIVPKCQLCKEEDVCRIDTKIRNLSNSGIKVYECKKCGVQFLYPCSEEADLKKYYNENYRGEYAPQSYYEKGRKNYAKMENFFRDSLPEARIRAERVKKFLRKSDEILEIGCASGYFLKAISNFVRKSYGTEWDSRYAAYAKKIGFEIKENPSDFNRKFDGIFMFHVLEHIKSPVKFLKDLKKVMKKSSILFIEMPSREDALIKLYNLQSFKDFYYQSAHLWYFNRKSLKFVLDKAGLKSKIEYIQRYDLSNHIKWLRDKKPGGQGMFNFIFSQKLKNEYAKNLMVNKMADTLFAIAKLRK